MPPVAERPLYRRAEMRRLEWDLRNEGGIEGKYRALYREGRTVEEIAEQLNIKASRLRRYIVAWNRNAEGDTT